MTRAPPIPPATMKASRGPLRGSHATPPEGAGARPFRSPPTIVRSSSLRPPSRGAPGAASCWARRRSSVEPLTRNSRVCCFRVDCAGRSGGALLGRRITSQRRRRRAGTGATRSTHGPLRVGGQFVCRQVKPLRPLPLPVRRWSQQRRAAGAGTLPRKRAARPPRRAGSGPQADRASLSPLALGGGATLGPYLIPTSWVPSSVS